MRRFVATHEGPNGELYTRQSYGWVSEFVWHHGGRPISFVEAKTWGWEFEPTDPNELHDTDAEREADYRHDEQRDWDHVHAQGED